MQRTQSSIASVAIALVLCACGASAAITTSAPTAQSSATPQPYTSQTPSSVYASRTSCLQKAKDLVDHALSGSGEAAGLLVAGLIGGVTTEPGQTVPVSVFGSKQYLDLDRRTLDPIDPVNTLMTRYFEDIYHEDLRAGRVTQNAKSIRYRPAPNAEVLNEKPTAVWRTGIEHYERCKNVSEASFCKSVADQLGLRLSKDQAVAWTNALFDKNLPTCRSSLFRH